MPLSRSLQEVVLAIHLAEAAPMSVLDVAAWVQEFGASQPSFQELPPVPPPQIPFPGAQGFSWAMPTLPRIRLNSADATRFYVLQSDRVAFGWKRDVEVGQEADYPGYDSLRGIWVDEMERFSRWFERRFMLPFLPRLVELVYNNAYPLDVSGRTRRMGEVLKIIDPDYRPLNGFQATWTELSQSDGLMVSGEVGLAHVPPGQRAVALNYVGFCMIAEGDRRLDPAKSVPRSLDKLHERIGVMHASAVAQGA